jgi:Fic family protein
VGRPRRSRHRIAHPDPAASGLGERSRSNARQIVGNVAAMSAALALSDDLTAQAILDMHHGLLAQTEPDIAGKWREEQVWIGGSNLGPHGATFVPPQHSRVKAAIRDLVKFMSRDDSPVLVHAAIAHAQFETIHPFPDGNGRTGRALMHAMLRGKGLTRNVTVPISAGLLTEIDLYFEALTGYREGDLEPIVLRVANASYAAVSNGRRLASELREIRASWNDRVRSRKGTVTWRIAELLLRHPVLNTTLVHEELGIALPNVYRSLAPLEEAEVLKASGGQRDRLWRSPEVLAAVDAFAKRADRRKRPA